MAATYTQLPTAVDERPGLLRRAVRAIRRDWLALFGLVVIAIVLVCAVLGPWLAPDPGPGSGTIDMDARLLPPSREYPFGTDWLGRDMLSRVILGARIDPRLNGTVRVMSIVTGVDEFLMDAGGQPQAKPEDWNKWDIPTVY